MIPILLLILAIILSFESDINYDTKNYSLESKLPKASTKPDFSAIQNYKIRKKTFIKYMLAAIEIANKEICLQQQQIKKLKKSYNYNKALSKKQNQILDAYTKYYKIKSTHSIADRLDLLDLKVDTVPTSFILAQAILESGWGTSRFARHYNNYFGLHCFSSNCGVKALSANVSLEIFSDVNENVLGYYYRLNSGSKFKSFRAIRQKVNNGTLSSSALFKTLENYSELQNGEYRSRLIAVTKNNNLTQYDSTKYCYS